MKDLLVSKPPHENVPHSRLRAIRSFIRSSRILLVCAAFTIVACGAAAFVLWPAYVNPDSRMYTSVLGYAHVMRLLKRPFQVEARQAFRHTFQTPLLGEGTMQCDFYYVPIIPMARVSALHVEEGDHVTKGELLVELDDSLAELSLSSAKVAVSTAGAEQERVQIGSAYVLAQERPEKDRINAHASEELLDREKVKLGTYQTLFAHGVISRDLLVQMEEDVITAQKNFDEDRFSAQMSSQGIPESKLIAENAVAEAGNLLSLSQDQLKGYKAFSPASGVVDRVLIREGEYNQDAGKPGFVITSGIWFEAHVDQSSFESLKMGDQGTVFLEAYPGRSFPAKVDRIIPEVTFTEGGPAAARQIPSRGTDQTEWPSTFKVRLQVDAGDCRIVPGMTGFARVINEHQGWAILRDAVLTISAGKGAVRVVDQLGRQTAVPVHIGAIDEEYVEITEGLPPGAWIITGNHRFLMDGDQVQVKKMAMVPRGSEVD
jgi:multidrug resistance efflux pump